MLPQSILFAFPNMSTLLSRISPGLLFGLLLAGGTLAAQHQALWLEGGGATPVYAVSYEQGLWGNGRGWSWLGKAGLSLSPAQAALPLALTALSPGEPHHLTASVTATAQMRNFDLPQTDTYLLLGAGAGYRYQSRRHPWMLAASLHPLIVTDPAPRALIDKSPSFDIRIGVGFGYRW